MPIRLLPEAIASRIAAGEVVERPASVVKELVENSLDAGAQRIEVETSEGGTRLIRVRDDGSGIPADEIELAFRRHATSKLQSAEELERIATLGFRGEALASIASVSRLTCTSRTADEELGVRLRMEGGQLRSRHAVAALPGTEMRVEDLFFNVPARRKFLRSKLSERRHIDAFLTRYAIAYPHVAFLVVHDGRETLRTEGRGNPREALLRVYGRELGGALLEIPPHLSERGTIRVRGFVGPTTVHRANRGYITLFVNGRWIQDMRLTYAVIQAYHTLLPVKRYPVAFVMIELPPEEVDVNVHPAKTEVRFRDGDALFRAVQRAVRETVVGEAPTAATWTPPSLPTGERPEVTPPPTSDDAPSPAEQAILPEPSLRRRLAHLRPAGQTSTSPSPSPKQESASPPLPPPPPARQLPPLRVIGQVATMFIVAEGPDGLYLIDQHAAHERILYERMLREQQEGTLAAQPLLEPVAVTLPADEAARLEGRLALLTRLGLQVEPFGPATFLVRSLPSLLRGVSPHDILADIAAAEEPEDPIREALEEIAVRAICKRAAVKAGQVLSREEMERLVHDLEATRNPRTCPHGRPTILRLSVEQLAAQFERR